MPFCPLCNSEYPAGAKRCTECEADLVEDLPEEQEEEEKNLVLLYVTPNRVLAEFLKETLADSNIPCFLRYTGSFLEGGLGYVVKDQPGFRLYVPEDKYEESLAIKEQTVGNL
jgi:hypothetical protein